MQTDREFILSAVTHDQSGHALGFASKEMKGDKEVVLAAVNQRGLALHYTSEELKRDKEVILAAVNQDGRAFEYASGELKGDKEVVLAAVKQNGYALLYASEEMKGDKEVVLVAFHQFQIALKFASPALRNGGLRDYVFQLLGSYTVPSSVFRGTILCSTKHSTALAPDSDDSLTFSVTEKANDEVKCSPVARRTRSRTEANRTCLLSKLNLGDTTTMTLMKNIAAFAGVRCQEFCTVPWSHVKEAVMHLL